MLSETLSECQTVWIQNRTDIFSVLIWVQTVCNGYQQITTLPLARKELNKALILCTSIELKSIMYIFLYIFNSIRR